MIIPALTSLATAGYQYYQGARQKKMAAKLKPSNYVPPSVNEAVSNARIESNATSPIVTRGLERLKTSTANSIENAKRVGGSAGAVQQAVVDADSREKEMTKDLSVKDAQYRAERKQELNQMLGIKGRYEKESMDAYNASKSALTGASMQNKYNAVTNLGEGIINSLPDSAFEVGGRKKASDTGTTDTQSTTAPAAGRRASMINKRGSTIGQIGKGPLSDEMLQYIQEQMGFMRKRKPSFATGN
jgi:hypothetical protein